VDDTITTIYCLCDEFSKAIGHRDDPQARLSTAEVMTVALVVAAAFFGGNVERARRFLGEYGYVPAQKISKGRFNRRIHAIEPELWRGLFSVLAGVFKRRNAQGRNLRGGLPSGGRLRQHTHSPLPTLSSRRARRSVSRLHRE